MIRVPKGGIVGTERSHKADRIGRTLSALPDRRRCPTSPILTYDWITEPRTAIEVRLGRAIYTG